MAIYQGTMTEIIDEITQLLRLATEDAALALRWANLGYIDCVQRTECLQRSDTALMTAGCHGFSLPPEVLTIKKLVVVYPDGSESRPLLPVDLEKMLDARRSTTTVDPFYDRPWYTMVGENQIEVWPTPGAGQGLRFWYVRYPQALTATSIPEIREPWGSQLITYAACVEASRFKKDPLIGDYEAVYSYWIDRFQAHLNRGRNLSQFVFAPIAGAVPHDPSTDLYAWN